MAADVTDKQLAFWVRHVSTEQRRSNYFKNVFTDRVNHQNIQTGRSFSRFARKYRYCNERERKNFLKLNLFSVSTDLATSSLFLVVFFLTAVTVGNGVVSGKIGYFTWCR